MAEPPETNQRDLLSNRQTWFWLWGVPHLAFALGFFLGPPFVTVLWTPSLTVLGAACLVNAARCRRMHCYFTGPVFLLGVIAILAYGLGILPLGSLGWVWIGIAIIIGSLLLTYLPERLWGKYVGRS